MAQRYTIRSSEEMMAFGASVSRAVQCPRVISLSGDLGAGKTTMAKGMISALTGILPSEITSPTFQYVHFYEGPHVAVAHFDLWRLNGIDEFLDLGLEEYLIKHIAIVEWPERIQGLIPTNALCLETMIVGHGRVVTITPEIDVITVCRDWERSEECHS